MKKLTRRQQQFLSKFLDLYGKKRESLHYTALAEYIGVGKISAYEMLRLLEEHGLVEAEYELPANQRGPGRGRSCSGLPRSLPRSLPGWPAET